MSAERTITRDKVCAAARALGLDPSGVTEIQIEGGHVTVESIVGPDVAAVKGGESVRGTDHGVRRFTTYTIVGAAQ